MNPVITFDGPSGVGKGTIAQAIAKRFGFHYLDSGALYRVLGYAVKQLNVECENEQAVLNVLATSNIHFDNGAYLNDLYIDAEIRDEQIGHMASMVAKLSGVRAALLDKQRGFNQQPGLVADGRDMGTTVFVEAPFKFYLTASAQERAKRRYKQLNEKGHGATIGALFREIEERDLRDRSRLDSPLIPAKDAMMIDTTQMTIVDVMDQVLLALPESF